MRPFGFFHYFTASRIFFFFLERTITYGNLYWPVVKAAVEGWTRPAGCSAKCHPGFESGAGPWLSAAPPHSDSQWKGWLGSLMPIREEAEVSQQQALIPLFFSNLQRKMLNGIKKRSKVGTWENVGQSWMITKHSISSFTLSTKSVWKWNIILVGCCENHILFQVIQMYLLKRDETFAKPLLRIHLPQNLINFSIYFTFDDVLLIKREQLFSCIAGEEEFCGIRGNRPINRTLNAYSFSVETTSLKRILDVRVWPWYTMGSPSLPSQQSTSTQRQPLFKALCANAANKIRSVVQSQFCLVEPSQIRVHKCACLPWTKLVTQENGGGGGSFSKTTSRGVRPIEYHPSEERSALGKHCKHLAEWFLLFFLSASFTYADQY